MMRVVPSVFNPWQVDSCAKERCSLQFVVRGPIGYRGASTGLLRRIGGDMLRSSEAWLDRSRGHCFGGLWRRFPVAAVSHGHESGGLRQRDVRGLLLS